MSDFKFSNETYFELDGSFKEGFTVVPNYILNNRNLSYKAVGLYVQILQYQNSPTHKIYMKSLMTYKTDGESSVSSGINELINEGFLTREAIRNERGHMKGYRYTVHAQPVGKSAIEPKSENPVPDNPVPENIARKKKIGFKENKKKENIEVEEEAKIISLYYETFKLEKRKMNKIDFGFISKIAMYVLLAISVIFVALAFANSDAAVAMEDGSVVEWALNWAKFMAIFAVVLVVIAVMCVSIYNNLVKLRNNRENAFANIDVQLKQRHDLIPQLVATVKGYATHEKELLEKVTAARSAAMGATTINDKIEAENTLSTALSGLRVSLEAYPDLKANQNFLQLQGEISDIENKLAATRRFFNSTTKELNNAVQTFPSNLLAGMFGFKKEPMFEIPQTERATYDKAPEISF